MSHLNDTQRQENKQRFLDQCDNAISYWTTKGDQEQIEYFENLKKKKENGF